MEPPRPEPPRPNVLLIEDTESDMERMRRILVRQQHPVTPIPAGSLASARAALSNSDISLIFLDNSLPDGSGADFVLEAAANPEWAAIPIVVVSDWPTPFMYAKLKAANVRHVWTKSDFNPASVEDLLDRLLAPPPSRRASR